MDILVESLEYYYDEDFAVPFDIGISEENNNTNLHLDYHCENMLKYADLTDEDEENEHDEDFENEDFERLILTPDIFNHMKLNNFNKSNQNNKVIKVINLRHSYECEIKRPESTHSAVRMSCSSSSSPISSSSVGTNNIEKCNRVYFDTQNVSFNESIYSLKSRMPLFNVNNKNILVNYHLNFTAQDSLLNSSYISLTTSNNGLIDKKKLDKQNCVTEKNEMSDSNKYICNTADIILQNLTESQKTIFYGLGSINNKSLKPESILWRQVKFLLNYYYKGWKLLNLFKQFRKKTRSQCSSTDEVVFYRLNNNLQRKQSYSCSVLEIYNSINDLERRFDNTNLIRNCEKNKSIQNFSCQFPPKSRSHLHKPNCKNQIAGAPVRMNINQIFDYPGIGKVSMPKPTRLSSSAFLSSNLHSHLTFLQTSSISHHSDITCNRPHEGDSRDQSPRSLCNFNYHNNNMSNKLESNLKPCLRKEDEEEQKQVVCRPRSKKAAANSFKRKSVSFDCPGVPSKNFIQELREIPRKWGLLGSESRLFGDMMAVFECGRKESFVGTPGFSDICSVTDDATRFRGMVNEVIRAVKQISERLSIGTSNGTEKVCTLQMNNIFQSQLAMLCEMVSNGDAPESPLTTAIDNLIALMSDGLVVTSFSNKKVRISSTSANKAAMRLWLLVEETCRNPGTQSTSRKAELSELLREVRQMITNISSSSKDHQLRLRAFIASALKSGLLHVWIRSVVANETALQRFYCPEAFLRQARCGQSDALAALTVSLKALTSASPSPNVNSSNPSAPTISRPVVPPPVRIARRIISGPSSSSSKTSSNKLSSKQSSQKPLYSEENTESESCADESRSSQSECPPNRDVSNNNNIFSRATHPRTVKKSSSSHFHSNLSDSSAPRNFSTRSPIKSLTNQNFHFPISATRHSATVPVPVKTIRTQPVVSRAKPPSKHK